jgi:Bacterial PH domain
LPDEPVRPRLARRMSAGVPSPPSPEEAIDAAAEAVRDARTTDRDAILEAQRVLRHAEKVHDQAVRDAAKRLHQDNTDTDAAKQELAAARADRRWIAEARPLLDRVVGRLDGDEEVLDMIAGIAAGHDGVMVVTTRRVLFVAPRRTIDVPYEEIRAMRIRGRHFGARVTIVARDTKNVIGGLSPVRAAEIAELLNQQIDQHARR